MSDLSTTLPISPDNIHKELEHVEEVVTKWKVFVGNGIPGVDIPAQNAEEKLDMFLRQFTGELLYAAGKLQNVAMVLSDR